MAEADEEVKKLEGDRRGEAAGPRSLPASAQHRFARARREPGARAGAQSEHVARHRRTRKSPRPKASCARSPNRRRPATPSIASRATIRRSRTSSSARRRRARSLRDLERAYTQDYLAKEPKAIALRTRLAELERQIAVQREASQEGGARRRAGRARERARRAAARLQSQIASGRAEVGQFTARFNEYKSRQDDLTELEKTLPEATQKRARLEASERARMPAAKLIEAASTPREPWRPLYWRDTGIAAGAARSCLRCSRCGWSSFSIAPSRNPSVVRRPAADGPECPTKAGSTR